MREENELFSIQLPLEKLSALYSNIGETTNNDLDMADYGFNRKAVDNSLFLLIKTGLIEKKDGIYRKHELINSVDFKVILLEKIFSNFSEEIYLILKGKQRFDAESKHSYIDKNAIPLKYSGLMMILEECEEIVSHDKKWIIVGEKISSLLSSQERRKKLSLAELEQRLIKEKEIGAEAEDAALKYEQQRLELLGINKTPLQVSLIDVSAGYDILSFDKDDAERYIEVKSVDNKMLFHFSMNEIITAERYRKRYWLYLVNRLSTEITVIQDPYELFFEKDENDWALEPDGYVIHKI